MDALTQDLTQIGVPILASGARWQMTVESMNIESNVTGIVTGTGISTGNIEFWPYNAGRLATLPGIGGSSGVYDFNDLNGEASNYGSMQVHNRGAGQTLFACNDWDGNPTCAVDDPGIGNNPNVLDNPDWTFQQNAAGFTLKRLEVWVQPVPVSAAVFLFGSGLPGLAGIARRRARG